MPNHDLIREIAARALSEVLQQRSRELAEDVAGRMHDALEQRDPLELQPEPGERTKELRDGVTLIAGSRTQSETLETLLAASSALTPSCGLLVLRGVQATGYSCIGLTSVENFKRTTMDCSKGVAATVIASCAGSTAKASELDPAFIARLGVESSTEILLLPVLLKERVAALLIALSQQGDELAGLEILVQVAQLAMDLQAYRRTAPQPAAAPPQRTVPPPVAPPVPEPPPTRFIPPAPAPAHPAAVAVVAQSAPAYAKAVPPEPPAFVEAPPAVIALPFAPVYVPPPALPTYQAATALAAPVAAAPVVASPLPPAYAAVPPPAPTYKAPEPPPPTVYAPPAAPVYAAPAPEARPAPAPAQAVAAFRVEVPQPPQSAALSEAHDKARRFAKLLVEEIKLYNQSKVAEGRARADLYSRLRDDIEKSRAAYQKRYGESVRDVDYFNQELLRILADNNRAVMGAGFPG